MTKYRDDFTTTEADAELAARLNEITNGSGSLVLTLPMQFFAGRGYEAIISTSYPDALPLVSTYYDSHKTAGAVLRDGTWHAEHSAEDERAYRQRMIEYHGRYVTSAQRRLDALADPATREAQG